MERYEILEIKKSMVEKELGEGLNNYRTFISMSAQTETGLALANVTVIGYAFSNHFYTLFAFSSIIALLAILIRYDLYKKLLPIAYSIYHTEQMMQDRNVDFAITTSLKLTNPYLAQSFDVICTYEGRPNRMLALRELCRFKYFLKDRTHKQIVKVYLLSFSLQLVAFYILKNDIIKLPWS